MSSKNHSRSPDEQRKMKNEESKLEITYHFIFLSNTTEKKKAQKKPKLMEPVYLEQSESSSDNDSEFSDTSSKGVEEEVVGSSHRSQEIPNKSMCS